MIYSNQNITPKNKIKSLLFFRIDSNLKIKGGNEELLEL